MILPRQLRTGPQFPGGRLIKLFASVDDRLYVSLVRYHRTPHKYSRPNMSF
jgi:hypothetical protein